MKFLFLSTIFLLGFVYNGNSQSNKKLGIFCREEFNPEASICVEKPEYDELLATDILKNNLVMNGFKVISERVAKERVELINKGQISDSTFGQKIPSEKTKYINSVYIITYSYKYYFNSGVISEMNGQVVDLVNDGEIVATFSFKQSPFGKNTQKVMNELAEALKEKRKSK